MGHHEHTVVNCPLPDNCDVEVLAIFAIGPKSIHTPYDLLCMYSVRGTCPGK